MAAFAAPIAAFLQLSGFAGIKQLLGANLAQTVFRNETDYQGMLEFIRLGQPFDAMRIEAYRPGWNHALDIMSAAVRWRE